MSTIQTLQLNNLGGSAVPPPPNIITPAPIGPKQPLMSDDDIDKLIESQRAMHQTNQSSQAQVPQPQPVYQEPKPEEPTSQPSQTEAPATDAFDLTGMNTNLGAIVNSTKERIKGLQAQQNKIAARIELLEKFIKLDEKELAIEVSKDDPNQQRIRGIRNAISNQTELFGNTLDILLKFESSIYTWTKALMDIEKDKVSAYQKIKSVNKEQSSTETDINEVLLNLNNVIRNNPDKIVSSADNFLNINGYGGKKFNS